MTAAAADQNQKAPSRRRRAVWIAILVIVVLVIAFLIASGLSADFMWFDQLRFTGVLTTEWGAHVGMFCVGFLAMGLPTWVSIVIAHRARPVYTKLGSQVDRYQEAIEPLRRVATWLVPAALGLIAGFVAAGQWQAIALYLNRTPFGETDPQFGLDLGFYFFELPFYRGLVSFALWAVALALILAFLTVWLYGGLRLTGRQLRISRAARIQLAVTLGLWLLLQAVSLWLDEYSLLVDPSVGFLKNGGAGFTEVHALIPGKLILAGAAVIVAILCFVTAWIGRWRFPLVGLGALIVLAIVIGSIYPWIVQKLQVEPSAQSVEAPYIQRSIDATRKAFGVADVDVVPYTATTDAEPGALRQDAATTANIRIIDPSVAPATFKQLQQFKQYYSFDDMDVDRYMIDGKVQDTIIAARDVNLEGLGDAQNWYNNTLVYTHGYGVVAAYGNQREADGQPKFFESGIPSVGDLGDYEPRIYFGQNSPPYSIVGAPSGSDPVELDYPSGGSDSAVPQKTTFTGDGGPKLDNLFARMVYAIKFQSSEILFSNAVNEDSQILYDRSPLERVQQVAPYLTLDTDPYPAIVDGRMVWIVDGYTTGNMYPYSASRDMNAAIADAQTAVNAYQTQAINYIRNSVKATVDAYDGKVTLYAWDANDPVLATWEKVFPGTVQPASEMSPELQAHVRYPEDLFKVQREVLGQFHVTDPGSFYSGEDQWTTPTDPVDPNSQLQPPYYLTMQVPGTDAPGYTLYTTYIPNANSSNSRQVLSGFLSADGDAGPNYGKLTLLTIPTQSTPAPGQVFTNFKTDPTVSSAVLSLTAGGGNQIVYGNLLTLPVGGGLLYVQPVYVQASSGTTFPLLRKVLVSFGDSIAFEDTLDEALDTLFGGDSGASAGDSGEAGGTPTTPPSDGGTGTPTSPPTGEPTETPTPSPTGSGEIQDPAALQQALADYQQALSDRNAAYQRGDLVAAAQADQRMRDAIAQALAAAGD